MDYIFVLIWIVFLIFCLFNCIAPCLREELDREIRDYIDDETRHVSEIEMVEVRAVPMTPRSARQCTNKIIITTDNEII
jgi:hypothetical protein